jgi:MFS superfamily sulfate permease-like transporter
MSNITGASIMRRPSAFLPLAFSAAALAVVVVHVATAGTAPQADEGTAAHLWQFLMAAQVPVILYFAITLPRRYPRSGLAVLAMQAVAVIVAAAPVFILRW